MWLFAKGKPVNSAIVWPLSVAATTASVLIAMPQIARVRSSGHSAGVSLPGWVNGCISNAAWLGYIFLTHAWPLLPPTILPAIPWGYATWLVWRSGEVPTRWLTWFPVIGWTSAVTASAALGVMYDPRIFGAVLALSAALAYGPQAWRVWTATRVDGIAPMTYWLAAFEGVAYGYIAGKDRAVLTWAVVVGSCCAMSLIGLRRHRLRAR